MTIVVDASVAVKWVLDEDDGQAAAALRDQGLTAPALWLAEAANALRRRAPIGELTNGQAAERLAELLNAPGATVAIEPYLASALDLAAATGHPVYDCLYLAVAMHHQIYVVTADRRFATAVKLTPFGGGDPAAGAVNLLTRAHP